MWVPGYEAYFNQGVSNQMTASLARAYMQYSIPEAAKKRGIPDPARTVYKDVISPTLNLVPHLPPVPVAFMMSNEQVMNINLSNSSGGA